ncbi:MAG: hypothetical protein JXQ96_09530 [Cyclobacteriaceae bacterium]
MKSKIKQFALLIMLICFTTIVTTGCGEDETEEIFDNIPVKAMTDEENEKKARPDG